MNSTISITDAINEETHEHSVFLRVLNHICDKLKSENVVLNYDGKGGNYFKLDDLRKNYYNNRGEKFEIPTYSLIKTDVIKSFINDDGKSYESLYATIGYADQPPHIQFSIYIIIKDVLSGHITLDITYNKFAGLNKCYDLRLIIDKVYGHNERDDWKIEASDIKTLPKDIKQRLNQIESFISDAHSNYTDVANEIKTDMDSYASLSLNSFLNVIKF